MCDPVCAPIEACLLSRPAHEACCWCCITDLRSGVLRLGVILGSLQMLDLVLNAATVYTHDYFELVQDLLAVVFFGLGSWSVFQHEAKAAQPVLRFGVFLWCFRLLFNVLLMPFMTGEFCDATIKECGELTNVTTDTCTGHLNSMSATKLCAWDGEKETCGYVGGDTTVCMTTPRFLLAHAPAYSRRVCRARARGMPFSSTPSWSASPSCASSGTTSG